MVSRSMSLMELSPWSGSSLCLRIVIERLLGASHKHCFWAFAKCRLVSYALRNWSLVEFLRCAVPCR